MDIFLLTRCLLVLSSVIHVNAAKSRRLHRHLQDSDFAELNAILQRAILNISGGSLSEGLVLDASIADLECRNAQLVDATVDSIPSKQYIHVNISVIGVSAECTFRYSYRTLLFSGSGSASVTLRGNRASVGWQVMSDSTNMPTRALVTTCSASIAIEALSFEKGLLGLAPVETLLRRVLQNRAEGAMCNALTESSVLQDAMQQFNAMLAPYQEASTVNPLSEEASASASYLDFQTNATTKEGRFVRWILNEATKLLSTNSGNRTNTMRMNVLLRKHVLEQDGSVSIDDIPWEGISTQDRLTRTTMQLNSLQLVGLDTMSLLRPLEIIGSHTLQSVVSFETLSMKMNATVTIRPSMADNAFVTVPGPPAPPVEENIEVIVSWNHVNATAALFLPIQQQPDLLLGSLLRLDHIAPCLLSQLGESLPLLTSLSLSFQDVKPPTLRGFVSKGIDRVVSRLSVAFVEMYRDTLLEVLPNVFQQKIRPAVNAVIHTRLREQSRECPPPPSDGSKRIDLRELVRPEGSRYGDVIPELYANWNERFVQTNAQGIPNINEALILPITEAQSGVGGQLHFTKRPLMDYKWNGSTIPTLANKVQLRISSPRVEHLDSVVSPLHLLEIEDASILHNHIRLGSSNGKQLSLHSEIVFIVESEGDASPLSAHNTFGFSVSLQPTIGVDLLLSIIEDNLLHFRMSNILDPFCWLDVLDKDNDLALAFQQFQIKLNLTDITLECWYCTSMSGNVLPEIMDVLRETEILAYFERMVERSLQDFGQSYITLMEEYLWKERNAQKCPTSPLYSFPEENKSKLVDFPAIPSLSVESIDSLLFSGMFALQGLLIVTARAHLDDSTAMESTQSSFSSFAKSGLIDWRDLNSTMGSWASGALESVKSITETKSKKDFGVEPGFNNQRLIKLPLEGIEFSFANTTFTFDSIEVGGLDSASNISLFEALAPHAFLTRASLSHLTIFASLTTRPHDHLDDIPFAISVSFFELVVKAVTLLEINWNKLGRVKVGSILHLQDIFPCVVSKIDAFNIERFDFEVGNLTAPAITGMTDNLTKDALKSLDEHLFPFFVEDIRHAVPIIMNTTVRNSVNTILNDFMTHGGLSCLYNGLEAIERDPIDFRDLLVDKREAIALGGSGDERYGNTFPSLLTVVRRKLKGDGKSEGLNEALIRPMTIKQSQEVGTLFFEGIVVDYAGSASLSNWDFEYIFRIRDVKLENLDTVGSPISLLQPVEGKPFSVNNSISLGTNSTPILFSASAFVHLFDTQGNSIENDVTVQLSINDLALMTILTFQLSESLLFATPLTNLLNGTNCWFAAIEVTQDSPILEYFFRAEEANLTISCNECKTTRFDELIQNLYHIGETSEDVDTFISTASDIADRFLSSAFLRNMFASVVEDAKLSCPSNPNYDPTVDGSFYLGSPETYFGFDPMKRDPKMKIFNIVSGALLAVLLFSLFVIRFVLRAKRKKWRKSLPEERANLLQQYEDSQEEKSRFLDEQTTAMHRSTSIPAPMRYWVPTMLAVDLLLYIVAHFATLSYVNITANVAGDDINITRFIEFSFFQAAMRTYRSGGNEMALMIIVFSGVWPYLKILTSLSLWFLPPTRVSVKQRRTIFLWMDVLMKLSIVDIALLIILLATVLLLVGGPGGPNEFNAAEDLYSLSLLIVPQVGFYCILIAQRLNRVSSRVLLEYQEAIETAAIQRYYDQISFKKSDACCEIGLEQCISSSGRSASFHEILSKRTDRTERTSDSLSPPSRLTSNYSYSSVEILESCTKLEFAGQIVAQPSQPQADHESQRSFDGKAVQLCQVGSMSCSHGEHWTVQCFIKRLLRFYRDHGDMCAFRSCYKKCLRGSCFKTGSDATIAANFAGTKWTITTVGVALVFLCVSVLFIIGCVLAPSISIDAKVILGLVLESGQTFNEVIGAFNVYQLICRVLLSSRFVLSSKADYFGLVVLISLIAAASLAMPFVRGYRAIRQWLKTHSFGTTSPTEIPTADDNFRSPLALWSPLLVYVCAFCLAIWQLGAVWTYIIHNFCNLSGMLFTALQYIGMIKEDRRRVQCFRQQASASWSLLIVFGSFTVLLVTFVMEVLAEHKKSGYKLFRRRSS